MTKMKNWAGSNVIARLSYCHCEPSFLPSLRAERGNQRRGRGNRYSSDEAAISRGKLADRDNYDYQKQSSIKNQLWRWRHRCLSMIA